MDLALGKAVLDPEMDPFLGKAVLDPEMDPVLGKAALDPEMDLVLGKAAGGYLAPWLPFWGSPIGLSSLGNQSHRLLFFRVLPRGAPLLSYLPLHPWAMGLLSLPVCGSSCSRCV